MAHSKISPSSAERWMTCPGSVPLCESLGIKGSPPTRYSAEGTFYHGIRAKILEGACVKNSIGTTETVDGFEFTATAEMIDFLRPGIERIRAEVEAGARLYVEVKVDLDEWIPGGWGTGDAVLVDDATSTITVDDLKFGSGTPVSAEWNPQLMCYGLGALRLSPHVENVCLRINQPRVAGGDNEWVIDAGELWAWGESTLKPAARAALGGKGALVPSDAACRWCPVRDKCPALAQHSLATVGFDDLDAPWQGKSLTIEQRSRVLEYRDAIVKWLDSLHSAALADALAGAPTPGWKAVAGRRGNRRWASETEAARIGGENIFERVLMSPARAEKMKALSKDQLAALTVQDEGKPCLVREDDKRPALVLTAKVFDVIADESNAWE